MHTFSHSLIVIDDSFALFSLVFFSSIQPLLPNIVNLHVLFSSKKEEVWCQPDSGLYQTSYLACFLTKIAPDLPTWVGKVCC